MDGFGVDVFVEQTMSIVGPQQVDIAQCTQPMPLSWRLGVPLAAALAVTLTLHQPGLTVDEPINVGHGKRLAYTLFHRPGDFLRAATVDALWRSGHEHPPLCRFLIGLAHSLADGRPDDPAAIVPKAGRPIGAVAFAVIVWLCMDMASRVGGRMAGLGAGLAAALLPRLFAHAHLASPEVISAAFFLATLRSATMTFGAEDRTPALGQSLRTGIWLGLALLAKLTNVLLVPTIAVLALWQQPRRAPLPLIVCFLAAGLTLLAGWPWLWPFNLPCYSDGIGGSIERLREFLGVGLDRATIYVWYFGKQYPNAQGKAPWHFVWVYFGSTIPVATLLLGMLGGAIAFSRQLGDAGARRSTLLGAAIAVAITLAFFSLPIERYDSERIFLFAFPPFAVLAGVGAGAAAGWLARFAGNVCALIGVLAALVAPLYDVVQLHPVQLSYFNALVGGLRGAEQLGLEATYWGDSLTEEFLDAYAAVVPRHAEAGLLPTLYAGHAIYLKSKGMVENDATIAPGEASASGSFKVYVLFNRAGYLHDPLPVEVQQKGQVVAELSRDGVWLARAIQIGAGGADSPKSRQ